MDNKLALSYDISAIDNANLADSTKAQYRKAITNYLNTGSKLGDTKALTEYAIGINKSSRAFLKAAIKIMTANFALGLKASATPENLNQVQASLYRLEAIDAAIQVKATKGIKAHTWLSQKQVKELMTSCGEEIVGLRDWIILGLLVGAGLRREELANLKFEDVKEQPLKNGNNRSVLSIKGKGAKDRVIPIHPVLAKRILEWKEFVGDGYIARSLGRKKEIGESLSAIGVFNIVRKHGGLIGIPGLDPHDLRRTYAQLGYEAGVPLTQISKLLGHATISTTQRYLNLELDLETTISDFIPLNGS